MQAAAEQPVSDPYPTIPSELKKLSQWVVWQSETRNGKPTKVPYDPITGSRAKSNDRSNWTSYWAAVRAAKNYSGIGFMFSPPYIGVDLDKCRNSETGA